MKTIILLLVLFLHFSSIQASEIFSGIPAAVSITSHRIFEEQHEGINERVTEVCFNLKTYQQELNNLVFSELVGEFGSFLSDDLESNFVNLPSNRGPGFIHDLGDFELRIGFSLSNNSLLNQGVRYTSSVFEENFNVSRKSGQVSYENRDTGVFSSPSELDFCEVYFFNNFMNPESLIEFLLSQDTVAFVAVQQSMLLDIELVRKSDQARVVRYQDNYTFNLEVPVAGSEATAEVYSVLSRDVRDSVVNQFNIKLNAERGKYIQQKDMLRKWHSWMIGSENSGRSLDVIYPKGCEYSAINFGEFTSVEDALNSNYADELSNIGCESVVSAVLIDDERCINMEANSVCELRASEGLFYFFTNIKSELSLLYIDDSMIDHIYPGTNALNDGIDISLPEVLACRNGLLSTENGVNNLSNLLHLIVPWSEEENDIRFISEEVITDIVRELSQDSMCGYNPKLVNIKSLICDVFVSGNQVCSHVTTRDLWHMIFTRSGNAAIFYSSIDADGDGYLDNIDRFITDATEWFDTDSDEIGNNQDDDDDGDSVLDSIDIFPLDVSEWLDTDLDGIGNNRDTDDDNDGTLDYLDAFPYDSSESLDTDYDGIGNNLDDDDDGDGVLDSKDAFPLDRNEWQDTDGDGVGDNRDQYPDDQNRWTDLAWFIPVMGLMLN